LLGFLVFSLDFRNFWNVYLIFSFNFRFLFWFTGFFLFELSFLDFGRVDNPKKTFFFLDLRDFCNYNLPLIKPWRLSMEKYSRRYTDFVHPVVQWFASWGIKERLVSKMSESANSHQSLRFLHQTRLINTNNFVSIFETDGSWHQI
jgi:hypothetical protein